ncbi:MAG: GNAT family N-acetyltransferase [Saprospiraceae bacterium]|nr:GNAT family N-acetyltransferase [Saprospiraceae bacterium]
MIKLLRTDSGHPDFIRLVGLLDAELAVIDGEEHAFYHQFNKVDAIKYALVAYLDGQALACGALKAYDAQSMEVKRMYTLPGARGKGVASSVLTGLETWARELGFEKCVLETGIRQPDAIRLYTKNGYAVIPNYGQYAGVENSVCFEKKFT